MFNTFKNTIIKNGGTLPEDMPTPDKSLKEIEKENHLIGGIKNE